MMLKRSPEFNPGRNAEQQFLAYVDANAERLYSLLQQLIAIETENHISHGNEAACAPLIKDWYQSLGLETEVYFPDDIIQNHTAFLPGRGTDKRPNVAGVYRGLTGQRRLMLAAHTDTMPLGKLSDWRHNPLGGEIDDGKLYGRGSGDNKFGIATGVFLLEALRDLGIRLNQDIVLSAYCDEEYGGGNGSIASCVRYPCDMYINLDGGNSSREVWTCAVGGQILACRLEAFEPQDSGSLIIDGLNIIKEQAEAFGRRRRSELNAHPFYRGTDMERSALRILQFRCGEAGSGLSEGDLEFVFYTVSPKETIDSEILEMSQKLHAVLKDMGIRFSGFLPQCRYFDYIQADEGDPSIRLLLDCAGEVEGTPVHAAGSCLSDYFLYFKYGSPCSVSYGLLRDFKLEGGAHQPDEFIYCRDFVNHTKALGLFLLRWDQIETSLLPAQNRR